MKFIHSDILIYNLRKLIAIKWMLEIDRTSLSIFPTPECIINRSEIIMLYNAISIQIQYYSVRITNHIKSSDSLIHSGFPCQTDTPAAYCTRLNIQIKKPEPAVFILH